MITLQSQVQMNLNTAKSFLQDMLVLGQILLSTSSVQVLKNLIQYSQISWIEMTGGSYKFDFSKLLAEQGPVLVQKLKCYIVLTKENVKATAFAAVV